MLTISANQLAILTRIRQQPVSLDLALEWDQRPLIGLFKRKFIALKGVRNAMYFVVTTSGSSFLQTGIRKRKSRKPIKLPLMGASYERLAS